MDTFNDTVCCVICRKQDREGIKILDQFICHSCETDILTTDVEDERYAYFVTQLRSLLCGSGV